MLASVDTPYPRDVKAKAGEKPNTVVLNATGGHKLLEHGGIEAYISRVGNCSKSSSSWVVAAARMNLRMILAASRDKL